MSISSTSRILLGFLALFVDRGSAQCSGANRTIFLRADNRVVQSFNGITVNGVDQRRCFDLCSNNLDDKGRSIQCASFQFDSSSSNCVLSQTNVQPFGSGVLGFAEKPESAIYQKICVTTSQICEKPFTFDWIPQAVLLGFAPQVQRFPTVSECLRACLESAGGSACRSALFFYESQQCILNGESRLTRPDLFSNDTQGLIADYFDNACATDALPLSPPQGGGGLLERAQGAGGPIEGPLGGPGPLGPVAPSGYTGAPPTTGGVLLPPPPGPGNAYAGGGYGGGGGNPNEGYYPGPVLPVFCDQSRSVQFVVTENVGVQEGLERRLENIDQDQCRAFCETNKDERGQISGCQGFSLESSTRSCMLTGGLAMPRGNLHLIDRSGVNFYEKVCLAHGQSCEGVFPFTRIPAHVLVGYAGEVRRAASISECLDACLYARTEIGYDCHSVMYFYSTTECVLNTETRITRPDMFSTDTQGMVVDYFDNNCLGVPSTVGLPQQTTGPAYVLYPGAPPPLPQPQPGPLPQPPGSLPNNVQTPAPGPDEPGRGYSVNPWVGPAVDSTNSLGLSRPPDETGGPPVSPSTPPPSPRNRSSDDVAFSTDCATDGIRVNGIFKQPMTGVIFVKNKLTTCKEEFRSTDNVQLRIPLSESERDCGQKPSLSEQYRLTVVLQRNGIGVQGLMTSDDVMYEVTCDYSSSRRPLITTPLSIGTSENRTMLYPTTIASTILPAIGNPVPDAQVSMDLLRDGLAVSNVLLGEQLEVRWRITAPANIGFFVRDCSAERVGGTPPDPVPLQLITDGCPDQSVSGRIISAPVIKAIDGLATNITVFRFDGSRSVRLRCLIDMCAGECIATRCQIKNREFQSYGRRRKRANFDRPSIRQAPLVPNAVRKTTISGIFTIVDELPKSTTATGPKGNTGSLATASTPVNNLNEFEAESHSFLRFNGQICLIRPLFVGLMTTLALICTAEALVVTACCYSRHCAHSDDDESNHRYVTPDRLRHRLITAVRRSSFFATAFGGGRNLAAAASGSTRANSFSNSSTMMANEESRIGGGATTGLAASKKKRRRREEQRLGGSSTTTTSTSGDEGKRRGSQEHKNARRPMLPMNSLNVVELASGGNNNKGRTTTDPSRIVDSPGRIADGSKPPRSMIANLGVVPELNERSSSTTPVKVPPRPKIGSSAKVHPDGDWIAGNHQPPVRRTTGLPKTPPRGFDGPKLLSRSPEPPKIPSDRPEIPTRVQEMPRIAASQAPRQKDCVSSTQGPKTSQQPPGAGAGAGSISGSSTIDIPIIPNASILTNSIWPHRQFRIARMAFGRRKRSSNI